MKKQINNAVPPVPLTRLVREFVENRDGVHLVSEAEYTLCGDALEGDGIGMGDEFIPTSNPTQKRTITCPKCSAIILMCRGVKCLPNAIDHPTEEAK